MEAANHVIHMMVAMRAISWWEAAIARAKASGRKYETLGNLLLEIEEENMIIRAKYPNVPGFRNQYRYEYTPGRKYEFHIGAYI